jgi:hypothetical protein
MKNDNGIAIMVESKRDRSFHYFLILFVGLFFTLLSFVILIYETQNLLSTKYKLIELLAFLVACGLFPIYYVLVVDKIMIYNDRVKVNSFWGYEKKIIPFNSIVSSNEIVVKSRFGDFKRLIIKTNNFKYRIEQHNYVNYYELKKSIIKEKVMEDRFKKNMKRK